jgi:asparagine synthase (glutamine-hydrolysing)
MSFIAGIVRYDALTIPDEWIAALAASSGQALQTLRFGTGAVFLGSRGDGKACDAHELLLCDGYIGVAGRGPPQHDITPNAWGGDFALARWSHEARRLVMRRSHMGSRSLFYVAQDGVFAFASTLPALLALPWVSRTLDEGAICRTLCFDGTGPATETYHAAVRRLPGGHSLTLEQGALSLAPLPPPWEEIAPSSPRNEDAAEALRSLLVEVVESHLLPGKRVAVHLSGGLDSAAIACIAARRLKQQGRRLLALCSVLPQDHDGPESDERRFIEAVLEQEDNIDPVWIVLPDHADPFGALPRWFDHLGEPHHSTVTHAEDMLGTTGRAHGADIVLSGFGGDFFISAMGIALPELHLRRGRFGKALTALRQMRRIHGTGWWRLLRSHVARPLAGWCLRLWPVPAKDEHCAAPALIRRVVEREGRRPTLSITRKLRKLPHEEMDFILEPGHLERLLPGMRHVFADAFDQDLRFPLLDTRLIALVRALPEEELQRDGQPRSLMRRAMAGILPEMVRLRPDKGPAFDPALAAHCAAARPALRRWAETVASPQCWTYVDRKRFLDALDRIVPTDRQGWQRDMFSMVLIGARFAKFIDWHHRQQGVQP